MSTHFLGNFYKIEGNSIPDAVTQFRFSEGIQKSIQCSQEDQEALFGNDDRRASAGGSS